MTIVPTLFRNRRIRDRLQGMAVFILLALVITGPAVGGSERELRRDVINVIKDQMAAFRRDDGETAFSYASPDVQDQYGTAEAYLSAYAAAYKAVYRPKAVTFLNLAYSRGRLVQRVLIEGRDRQVVVALFPMIQLKDGSWRIDGCVLVPASGKSASKPEEPPFSPGPEELAAVPW